MEKGDCEQMEKEIEVQSQKIFTMSNERILGKTK